MNTDILKEIEELELKIYCEPYNANLYRLRGIAYRNMDNYKKAFEDYNKAIELEPDNPISYFHRGGTYTDIGEFNKALEDCNKALKLDPNNDEYKNLINEITGIMSELKIRTV